VKLPLFGGGGLMCTVDVCWSVCVYEVCVHDEGCVVCFCLRMFVSAVWDCLCVCVAAYVEWAEWPTQFSPHFRFCISQNWENIVKFREIEIPRHWIRCSLNLQLLSWKIFL
jgi:hypothetical protein